MPKTPLARGGTVSTALNPPRGVPKGPRPRAIESFLPCTHIAYFSMELAVRPEMHTYSGGLGFLAGDMARACADLEVPAVFVTMASRLGYLRQEIDRNGRQFERPDRWDPERWCQSLPIMVALQIEGRSVWIRPWLTVLSGHEGFQIPILLLDTDVAQNSKKDRTLTDSLYGGDATFRLKQEIVLGLGGLRLLRALGFDLHTFHMNEGHASLLTLDLLNESRTTPEGLAPRKRPYNISAVRRRCVFTTHTPVKAGHDRFDYHLFERLYPGEIDLGTLRNLAGRGRLNLTLLGLNLSHYVNGVSRRHAETARKMFPGYRIHAVTNGVHAGTWTHSAFAKLYDASFPGWRQQPELLVRAFHLAEDEVWDCHQMAKRGLLERIRQTSAVALDPEALTVVFARRMTGYKRPMLLFKDLGRLANIASRHRFQLVFAGKAHPRDTAGKEAIRRIHRAMRQLEGRLSCVFVPNYDMDWAKSLVAGGDVWLQTPLPPMEASGTSGMKAALNGGLNLSPLDGWWAEGCVEGVNGWSIAHRKGDDSDRRDAEALYDQLENVVLPCFYTEAERWRSMMKYAIAHVGSYFTSHRMLRQYAAEAYIH
ncbi:MAG: alpha-glucan family phosphorylase [Thermoplasmata archaeon]